MNINPIKNLLSRFNKDIEEEFEVEIIEISKSDKQAVPDKFELIKARHKKADLLYYTNHRAKFTEEVNPPEYTKNTLKAFPEKIGDLISEEVEFFEGDGHDIENLFFLNEILLLKETKQDILLKMIALSVKKIFNAETSFFVFKDQSIKKKTGDIGKEYSQIENLINIDIRKMKRPLLGKIAEGKAGLYHIYPYFIGDEYNGFSCTFFQSNKITKEEVVKLEMFLVLARCLYYE